MKRTGFAIIAAVLCSAANAPSAPVPGWTPAQVTALRHWVQAAPEDALPLLDASALDKAAQGIDQAEIDRTATALALRLARMHLLGCATAEQRAGWRIADTDSSVNLPVRLAEALAGPGLDAFFTGLKPRHPDYAVLRAAYATETIPARHTALARNMERWRWMPQSLGHDYVLVNAASFEVSLWRQEKRAGTWRVIVGKPSTPTPVFAATITGVTYNPWWDIPANIVRESVGSLTRRNPGLARKRGYVWSGGHYRQRPGPGNALGLMKLAMQNPYNVYLHDTPSKNLFARDVRAFSHGCIRVGDAMNFAATLLQGTRSQTEIDAIVARGATTTVDLPAHLPVYITYFTASPRADGTLAYQADIYNRDGRLGDMANPGRGCPAQG